MKPYEAYDNTKKIKLMGVEGELFYEQEPIGMDSSLGEMLSTSCGCEFYVEEDNETV